MAVRTDPPYCDPSDLASYLPATTLSRATPTQLSTACLDASDVADSYMRGRFALPLLDWGSDVRRFTAYIACYQVMTTIGFQPGGGGSDALISTRYYEAVGFPDRAGSGWFPGVQRQAIHPRVTPTVPQPGDATHDLPQVRSIPSRGWQQCRGGKPVI